MPEALAILRWLLLLPVVAGSCYAVATVVALVRFRQLARRRRPAPPGWPPVSLLKPVHGLEKGLAENLRSACRQDYPEYQVVFSVEEEADPALPLLRALASEYGSSRVTVVVHAGGTAPNGKVRNLVGALPAARHEVLVISDSDVRLRPDYLRTIVAPLADPAVGCVCTLYRAAGAGRWIEAVEQLTLNADFVPNLVFAWVTGASTFCLGASTALARSTLDEIGGMAALGDYLVEDFEMGRRIRATGKRIEILPYFVDTMVDLERISQWWHHQVYWDQNTRAANPAGHFGTLFIRAIPFALVFALIRGGDALGIGVLVAALAIRVLTAGIFMGWCLGDWKGVRALPLLPFRDLAGMVSALLAFVRPHVVWRGARIRLTADGRLVPSAAPAARESLSEEPSR
jgi:ceramide glucosyltransferase